MGLVSVNGVCGSDYIHICEDGGRKIQNGLAFWLVLTKFYMFERDLHVSPGGGAEQNGLRAMEKSAGRK
jgi:hypothetical protein